MNAMKIATTALLANIIIFALAAAYASSTDLRAGLVFFFLVTSAAGLLAIREQYKKTKIYVTYEPCDCHPEEKV